MRILGLDIGTTSVGFALIEQQESNNSGKILRMGVRIFPEARDPDGTPLNQQRRDKRTIRRQLRRRRERRKSLNELLSSVSLLPKFNSLEWAVTMQLDPYQLRDKGLAAALEPFELGRALYHLSKRRHFKERDIAEDDSKNSSVMSKKEVAEDNERESFVSSLNKSGLTIGQSLARRSKDEKKRGVHANRAAVLDEFKRLCNKQSQYHPKLKDYTFRGAVEEAIFKQRPVFWRKSTLGSCRLMPGEPLCQKGSWLSQQRIMLERVNNLAIVGDNARPLDTEERLAVITALNTQKNMSWAGVRKVLEPIFKSRGESAKTIHFNLEYGDEKGGLKGNIVEVELAKIFGSKWKNHPQKDQLRQFLPSSLWEADYGEIGTQRVVIRPEQDRVLRKQVLAERLVADFGASKEQSEALVNLNFPQGWEPFSTKALEVFLPELEGGERFGVLLSSPDREKWRDQNFPDRERPTGEILDKLPSPKDKEEATRIARIKNPTVVRVQNELRKVVNNLIRVYGKPDLIRIELARDVGKSKREREELSSAMRAQERKRTTARKDLQSKGIADPSRDDVEKWLLWKECKEQCPYTGDMIGFDDLFSLGNFEIEHIWPRSLSLDNSFRNKTLCRKDVNIAKGNRLPFEFFKGRDDEWVAAKDRVWKMIGRDGMSPGKAKRFAAVNMPDDFSARQLNDTSYAAREARAFLQRLWPDIGPTAAVKVQSVTGQITAQLRKRWGLNNILADDGEKTRDDHRHHAIDALVVACADGGYIQKLSRWYKEKDEGRKPHLAEPWPKIREDTDKAVKEIVVSHRVRKKVSGALHKETIYGDTGINEKTKSGTYRIFVTRKKVDALSKTEIENIVDDNVRQIISDWVIEHGGDPKKAFSTYPKIGEEGPEIRKVRVYSKQQLNLMAPVSTGYADLGNNHHAAIYKLPNGKIKSNVVSLFETVSRLSRREPLVARDFGDSSIFLMSLSQGDSLYFPEGKMKGYWTVQSIWSAGPIVLCRSEDAQGATVIRPGAATIVAEGGHKVTIDPIGVVWPASD